MANEEFWNDRVSKYGHTGWFDSVIYAYDQVAREKAICKILKSLELKKDLALDFGAGSGDFSILLSKEFKKVLAFDISKNVIDVAKKKYGHIHNIEFIQGKSVLDLGIEDNILNLVLSITVLGHIIDGDELISTINYFGKKLYHNSYLIALEYTPLQERSSNKYQRFMTFDRWLSVFSECGFKLEKHYGFFHPDESPCESYKLYRQSVMVRFLNIFKTYGWAKKSLIRYAWKLLQNTDDFVWNGQERDSVRIMIFKR